MDSTIKIDGIPYIDSAYTLGSYFWMNDREAYVLHINRSKKIVKAKFTDTNEIFKIRQIDKRHR